jgi:hypothetical protein
MCEAIVGKETLPTGTRGGLCETQDLSKDDSHSVIVIVKQGLENSSTNSR